MVYHVRDRTLLIRNFFLGIYLFFNLICGVYFIYDGNLGGDFQRLYITEPALMVIAILLVFFVFYMIQSIVFPLFEKINVNEISHCKNKFLDYFIMILLVTSLHAAISLNIGVSGLKLEEPDNNSKFYYYLLSVFQPVSFTLIYLFYRVISLEIDKTLVLNALLYTIYIVVSAQTIHLLTLFALFIIFLQVKNIKVSSKALLILTALGLSIYPVIRYFKYALVNSGRQNISLATSFQDNITDGFVSTYFDFFFKSIERFQMVANIEFIMEKWDYLSLSYYNFVHGEYSFLSSYWFIDAFLRRVLGENVFAGGISPQDFMAISINGQDTWSSHISFLGYVPFFGVYSILVYFLMFGFILTSILVSKKIMNNRYFLTLTWLMCLFLVCHGWFIPFINYTQSLLVFIFVVRVLDAFNLTRKQLKPIR